MFQYLKDIPLMKAKDRLAEALQAARLNGILGSEELPLDETLVGRVTAEPVWARLSSPHYHASAMDGFAIRAEDTAGAMPTSPVVLRVAEQAQYVDTGDPLPDWANTVIPIEQVESLDSRDTPAENSREPEAIRIRISLPPWSHVRPMGEDIVATQLLLPAGHVLRPVDIGAAAASGHGSLKVARKPVVAIFPTGTELVPVGNAVQPGQIIEYNSMVLAGQIRTWGGIAVRHPILPDYFEKIKAAVQQAAEESDLVIINAGSSAGSEDFTARVVQALGTLLVHGVAVRPGHPVILGMLRRTHDGSSVPVFGVPGYPVSAALTAEIFIEPVLAAWLGRPPVQPPIIEATLTRKVTSPAGDDDYMRVVVGKVGEKLLAAPLSRGAGVITSLVRADGISIIPRGTQGLEAGARVPVRLYRPLSELENTIFAIGSHDMSLDILAQFLAGRGRRLVSANVGSQGGLVALRRSEAHLAGCHLLDPDTGVYNLRYLSQYLPGEKVCLLGWVGRNQGLIVPRGNPKQINRLQDLIRPGIRFINRQRGAGTRVLLDYHLHQAGISADLIVGYDQEEYTHLSVAAAVSSGRADCGLGVTAAAAALNLDFIPLYHEEYDLVIPFRFMEEKELLRPFFDLVQDEEFRLAVASLPGYDISRMGKLIQTC